MINEIIMTKLKIEGKKLNGRTQLTTPIWQKGTKTPGMHQLQNQRLSRGLGELEGDKGSCF